MNEGAKVEKKNFYRKNKNKFLHPTQRFLILPSKEK